MEDKNHQNIEELFDTRLSPLHISLPETCNIEEELSRYNHSDIICLENFEDIPDTPSDVVEHHEFPDDFLFENIENYKDNLENINYPNVDEFLKFFEK